ncbi:hypothetical protein BDF20DRAFT_840319 [Mycotypha africana]|uniref:uncharacterized protein n=1 Tax=Mycotypha africana TaxID=64632 RepID=UPI0022FFE2FD|nr:uncharacterized protein BDF20DRAFT_840319 [Mycotypha africana]KAI8967233.1 hypothetical protein BDF20DRAFT_840319 [Mycotypha africana]
MSAPQKRNVNTKTGSTGSKAVSSIVDDLIRASAGAGAKNIADEDLDKYVADLILKEAQEKRKKYEKVGIQAYEPSSSRANRPKFSAGFLLNVVKQTDSSNRAAIRSNQETITKLRRERYKNEAKGRRSKEYSSNTGINSERQRTSRHSSSRSRSRSPLSSPHTRSDALPTNTISSNSNNREPYNDSN